jgi:hypothetical protein
MSRTRPGLCVLLLLAAGLARAKASAADAPGAEGSDARFLVWAQSKEREGREYGFMDRRGQIVVPPCVCPSATRLEKTKYVSIAPTRSRPA